MVNINLLAKKSQQKKHEQKALTSYLLVPIVIGLIIIICVHFYYTPQISTQRAKNSSLQAQIANISGQILSDEELASDQTIAKKAINGILKVKYQRYIALKIFKLITQLTPKNIYLLNILNKNGNIVLIGQTYSKKAVTNFLNQLGKINFITTPKLGEIITNKDTNLNSFKILFSIQQPLDFYDTPKVKKK
jgi:Tfp pilus assembly protein PilN